jgi:hypothetical protein
VIFVAASSGCSDSGGASGSNLSDQNYFEIQALDSKILTTDSPPRIVSSVMLTNTAEIVSGKLRIGKPGLVYPSNSGNTFTRIEPINAFSNHSFLATSADFTLEPKVILDGSSQIEGLELNLTNTFPDGSFFYKGVRTVKGVKLGEEVQQQSNVYLLSPPAYRFILNQGITIL